MRLKIIDNHIPAVIVEGGLAWTGTRSFKEAIDRALLPGRKSIFIDLTDVHYVDSGGLEAVSMVHRLIRSRGGVLAIAVGKGALCDLIHTCGFSYQPEIQICESYEECASRISGFMGSQHPGTMGRPARD